MSKLRRVSLLLAMPLFATGALWLRGCLDRQNSGVKLSEGSGVQQRADSTVKPVEGASGTVGGDREEASEFVGQATAATRVAPRSLQIESAPAEGLEFRVLLASDRTPVPGAVVSYLDWIKAPNGTSPAMGYDAGLHLLDLGQHYKADSEGVVRVPFPIRNSQATIACEFQGLWGRIEVHRSELPSDLWLFPNPSIDVHVVDIDGLPIPNAKVGLHYVLDISEGDCLLAVRTDEEGRACLTHLRQYTSNYWENSESLNVALIGLWDDYEEVRLDPPEFPEKITLTMPPSATVNVVVLDRDGHPYEDAEYVTLQPRNRPQLVNWEGVVVSECIAGRASFAQISPGMEFTVSFAENSTYKAVDIEGQAAAEVGQATEIQIRLDALQEQLTGVALDSEGAPMADAKLEATLFKADTQWTRNFVSDTEGIFQFDPGNKGDMAVRIRVESSASMLALRSAELLGFETHFSHIESGQSLGNCQFQELPLLVSGQAVDELGAPLELAEVTASRPRAHSWRPIIRSRAETVGCGSDGRFGLYGWTTASPFESKLTGASELELRGRAPGFFSATKKVALGSRDVRLELRRAGSIEGSVILDDNWHGSFLEVSTQRDGEKPRHVCGIGDGGRFQVETLAAGTYDFLFGVEDEPLGGVRIPDVVVKTGSRSEDPRLWGVDLRGRLRIMSLSVVKPPGDVRSPVSYYRRSSTMPGSEWQTGQRTWEQDFELYTMYEALDIQFHAANQKFQTVQDVQDGDRIEMEAGLRVRLALTVGEVEGHPERGAMYWNLKSLDPEIAASQNSTTTTWNHESYIVPVAGAYEVGLSLYKDRSTVRLERATTTIEVRDIEELQEFKLDLDLSDWFKATKGEEAQEQKSD